MHTFCHSSKTNFTEVEQIQGPSIKKRYLEASAYKFVIKTDRQARHGCFLLALFSLSIYELDKLNIK